MDDCQETVEQFEKSTLDTLRRAEESALEAARKWADAAVERVPLETDFLREVIRDAVDFTERVLKLQREVVVKRMVETGRVPRTKAAPQAAGEPTHAPRRPATKKAATRA